MRKMLTSWRTTESHRMMKITKITVQLQPIIKPIIKFNIPLQNTRSKSLCKILSKSINLCIRSTLNTQFMNRINQQICLKLATFCKCTWTHKSKCHNLKTTCNKIWIPGCHLILTKELCWVLIQTSNAVIWTLFIWLMKMNTIFSWKLTLTQKETHIGFTLELIMVGQASQSSSILWILREI